MNAANGQKLVTFRTRAYSQLVYFEDVARRLLKLMGQTGNVPGGLRPEDVGNALRRLEAELSRTERESTGQKNGKGDSKGDDGGGHGDEQPTITLSTRAMPLIELLHAASDKGHHVTWEY